MKQLTSHQTKVKNQIRSNSSVSLTDALETKILIKPMISRSNIFLVQNIGKDPPGRWCSPGVAYCLYADNRPVLLKSDKTLFNIDFQIFKQIQNPNYFNN